MFKIQKNHNLFKLKIILNKFIYIIRLFINILIWPFLFLPIKIIFPYFYKLLFQNKHYKPKEDINKDETKKIKKEWMAFLVKQDIEEKYHDECINILEYFNKFRDVAIFDKEKNNPQFSNITHIFNIISLAKEAIKHLYDVTANNKKISYYESNKKASLEELIQIYIEKLEANGKHKLLGLASKNEVKLKKFITKLKKHDLLFINFYLMLYTIYPIENLLKKKKDEEFLELSKGLFDFFRVGHATKPQINKSVAIQIYKLYGHNISKINLPQFTTKTELETNIGKLIDYTFQTDKVYKNFNKINEEAYVKNVIYNFPLFENDYKLANKQIRRFKFYFIGKNTIARTYWRPIFEKIDIAYRNPYQMRHTFASMMISNGEDILWVSKMLGHTNSAITLTMYARYIENKDKKRGAFLTAS